MHNHVSLMQQAIRDGVFPAAQLLAAQNGKIIFSEHYGLAQANSLFDLASLTKPLCTASLCLLAFHEGKLKPETRVQEIFPESKLPAHREITVLHLLEHISGLPSWQAFFQELPLSLAGSEAAYQTMLAACLRENIVHPVGSKSLYSDLGFLLLGFALERTYQKTLEELFNEKISKPFGLKDVYFLSFGERQKIKHSSTHVHILPTQDCPWRGHIVSGKVDDANAFMLGGVAGHAGLFGNASALHQYLVHFWKILKEKKKWIAPSFLELFDFRRVKNRGDTFLCGWNLPSKRNSAAGNFFSKQSLGHLGFTGCSAWMDMEKNLWVILLSNRVHPNVNNQKIKQFRPLIHDAIMNELKG